MSKDATSAKNAPRFADSVKSDYRQLSEKKTDAVQAANISKADQQLNVWISKDLMKRLKIKGAEADKSLKQLVIEALEQFITHGADN